MLPLQLTRIFDYQQPSTDQFRGDAVRGQTLPADQPAATQHPIPEDRRKQADRRALERREKQQATFLNTRKAQGRRRSDGRRMSDMTNKYRPISLKG